MLTFYNWPQLPTKTLPLIILKTFSHQWPCQGYSILKVCRKGVLRSTQGRSIWARSPSLYSLFVIQTRLIFIKRTLFWKVLLRVVTYNRSKYLRQWKESSVLNEQPYYLFWYERGDFWKANLLEHLKARQQTSGWTIIWNNLIVFKFHFTQELGWLFYHFL